ncbi:TAXI family TRAP transporter solute-binding subunit [Vibrio artabrorum]|uniref:TAXI family TRAP transporter solute-binding subunit n=1 Tax=Vibrio artabrorum TaxID=446374 RepID=UPI00354F35C0
MSYIHLKSNKKLLLGCIAAFYFASMNISAKERLAVGTTSSSSSQYGYYVAVAQVLKNAGISLQVVETGASLDNLRRLSRNQIDMGLVTTNIAKLAADGDPTIGKKMAMQTLWVYAQLPQNIIVRKDSGIKTIESLNGRKFNPGIRGAATESTAIRVFKAIGVAPDFVRGSTTDTVDAIKDNRITGYVKSGVGNKVDGSTLDLASFSPIEILSLTNKQRAIIKEEVSDVALMDVPENSIEGSASYTTWSMGFATVVRPDFDEESAYKIAKAVFEDKEIQAGAFAVTGQFDLKQLTIDLASTPLHPGVIRYLEEQNIVIPDRLRPSL